MLNVFYFGKLNRDTYLPWGFLYNMDRGILVIPFRGSNSGFAQKVHSTSFCHTF